MPPAKFLPALLLLVIPAAARSQTLTLNDEIRSVATLTNTAVTLSGRAELHITGSTGDPLSGSTVNLTSPDSWFFMDNTLPSVVLSSQLSKLRVNGAAAVSGTNVRVVEQGMGAAVIPQAPAFPALTVFDGKYFTGPSKDLLPYTAYNDIRLGPLKSAISSFRLKRGYMATVAQQESGNGQSRSYVAQDGDLEVGLLPAALDNNIRFVRIFPWRAVAKKGFAGNQWQNLKTAWFYNWNLDQNSTPNVEYVPIRQTRWWPGLDQDWKARGSTHLLGYNEPDSSAQANIAVGDAVYSWPDLLATGLRVGAPAVTDGGLSWLYSFIDQCDAAGLRVDFVPLHYYRSYSNAADPDGATSQLYNFLKGVHDRVKRPLWLTEFNNGANWTTGPDPTAAQQKATVTKMMEMLDNTPWVERYSIYNWVEDVRRVVWDDGSTTPAGDSYRDNVSPLAYLQEMADAGTGTTARYPFDGDARDAWGNGQDGMMVGTPKFTAGKFGQAVSLNGSTDYIQLSPRLADSTDFTFAGWIYWNGGANWQRVFDFGDGQDRYLALTPKSGSGTLRFLMRNGGDEQQLNAAAALPSGVWTHVAVTISGDIGRLYVNGALVNTNTAMTINPVDVGTRLNYLGRSQFADPLFNGRLDDLRFTSSAMSAAQISALYAQAPPRFSSAVLTKNEAATLALYSASLAEDAAGGTGALSFSKMGGPAWLALAADGTLLGVPTAADTGLNSFLVRVTDAAGAIHTASLQIPVKAPGGLSARYPLDGNVTAAVGGANGVSSGSPAYVAGKMGTATDLDGTDDFVKLPAGIATMEEITIAVWMNWDGGANWQRLLDFGNGEGEYFFISPKSGSGTLRFAIKNDGAEQTLNTTPPPVGQWTHLAVTLGGGTGRLYVNGVLKDSQPLSIRPSDFAPATNYLGKSQFADPLFNGRLDELCLFPQVLSAEEIATLMSARAPAFLTDPIAKPDAPSGQDYTNSLTDQAADPDAAAGGALSFRKISGPAWLRVGSDGKLSGRPAFGDTGSNRFIVRVSDSTGFADDAVLNITVPPVAELAAQWSFDGSAQNTVGGAVASLTGAPVYASGIFDRALIFDGTDDSVTLPANPAAGLTEATFAARLRWDGGAAWQRIFDIGGGTTQYMILTPSSGTGTVQFAITADSAAGVSRLEGTAPLPVGEWAHVAVTLGGGTGTLYVNGAPVATGPVTASPAMISQTKAYLGKSQFTADPLFKGTVDDFRIYSRSLSPAEVAALADPVSAQPPALDYAAWSAGFAFPAGMSGAAADPDQDGAANVFEYLLGGDPLVSDPSLLDSAEILSGAELGLAAGAGKHFLTLKARVRSARPGITLSAQAAATLDALSAVDAASHARQAGAAVPDGNFEVIRYPDFLRKPAFSLILRGFPE